MRINIYRGAKRATRPPKSRSPHDPCHNRAAANNRKSLTRRNNGGGCMRVYLSTLVDDAFN